ncbi:hypothetical protein BV20DRAFT_974690 [Pilatotrama ljubarskyi]|nr:hypothetical protein BV20DRAFT_974690 [Pilatotrama ljubarskyi]
MGRAREASAGSASERQQVRDSSATASPRLRPIARHPRSLPPDPASTPSSPYKKHMPPS